MPKILIVEDHDTVRDLLKEWLGVAFPSTQISEAKSGEEAIDISKTEPVDVIIMDIGLPCMNGIDTTRRIRQIVPQAQVVMLTIYEDRAFRVEAEAAGANAYVPKRTMQTELLHVVADLLADG